MWSLTWAKEQIADFNLLFDSTEVTSTQVTDVVTLLAQGKGHAWIVAFANFILTIVYFIITKDWWASRNVHWLLSIGDPHVNTLALAQTNFKIVF